MIRLLQSNNMQRLVEAFVGEQGAAPANPFEPVSVVVQNFGMGQWLKLQLAQFEGIAANVDCILPAELIWRMYRLLLDDSLPDTSPFATEKLAWHLMQVLPECSGSGYAPVQAFLAGTGDSQVRQYQLAEKIAGLFDQYLVYRPQWINDWQDRKRAAPNSWQADLWRQLVDRPGLAGELHRARLHQALIQALGSLKALPSGIPHRLSIFGVSSLAPMQLETFRALGRHIHVDLYFLNPCQHYWGDIVSEKDTARRSLKQLLNKEEPLEEDDYLEVGNPLLSSMGKQGREYLELLLEIDELEIYDAFDEPKGDTMLDFVKRDIVNLTFGGEYGTDIEPAAVPVARGDISIQLHACHSKLREVEVLQDQLLRIIDRNPGIRPGDIIVMAPNIADYAPYIDAVFSRDTFYYSIADRPRNTESAALVAFLSLMSLTDMRLTGNEVMALLETPAIARKFQLNDDDIVTLASWINESGIRWELDGESKRVRWQVPGTNENTWQFGIDRMLLGYAMTADAGTIDGVLPFDLEAGDGELLGTLCQVVERLAQYRELLTEPRPAGAWRETVLQLLDDFFEPLGQEELALTAIRDLLIRLETDTTAAGLDTPLNVTLVRYWLEAQLARPGRSRGFISGGMTFATLVPMRSIPFKVVCLLGMNDGEYPREDRPPGFDLMESEGYRKGDRSRRNDDRYLFLEALLSASDHFYISYEGRRLKDNQDRPPSVLVSELIDYLDRVFDNVPVTVHPLQPFSEDYFRGEGANLVSWQTDWYRAIAEPLPNTPFIEDPLDADEELIADNLETLAQFYRSPARAFLRNRLRVFFDEDDVELKDTETFDLDHLERYGLAQSALDVMLAGDSVDDWQDRIFASGQLIAGDIGKTQLNRELDKAGLIFDALAPHLQTLPSRVQDRLALPSVEHPLEGGIDNLYGDALVDYRTGQLRKRQLMEMWIRQLFVNATGRPVHTISVAAHRNGKSVDTTIIHPMSREDAVVELAKLVDLYNEGMRAPLPFLPETSFAYAEALATANEDSARQAALAEWLRESRDREYARLYQFPAGFTTEFHKLSREICEPIMKHWGPLK